MGAFQVKKTSISKERIKKKLFAQYFLPVFNLTYDVCGFVLIPQSLIISNELQ